MPEGGGGLTQNGTHNNIVWVVPFGVVLLAAREVGASPTAVAKRLHACNIPTSHDSLPRGLAFSEALRLLRVDELPEGEMPDVRYFPLEHLHKTALRKGISIPEVVSLIRRPGAPSPTLRKRSEPRRPATLTANPVRAIDALTCLLYLLDGLPNDVRYTKQT